MNIKASGFYKRYNESLPIFLHNRPSEFLNHCRKRLLTAEEVQGKIVADEGMFTIQSFTDQSTTYQVTLGTDLEVPSCQCPGWMQSHWPCEHLLAVVMHCPGYSWENIADHYRNNPMFVLDQLCMHDIGFKIPPENQLTSDSNVADDSADIPPCTGNNDTPRS